MKQKITAPRTMNAVRILRGGPVVVEIPTPSVSPGLVLVKVDLAGLCGSDLQRIHMIVEGRTSNETTLGHEIVGTVVAMGGENPRFKNGDRVVVNPIIPCMRCENCRLNLTQLCKNIKGIGKNVNGGFAEYVLVPVENLYKVSHKISPLTAVLFDDVAVAVHTRNLAGGFARKKVCVVGNGSLGVVVARLAILERAESVVLFGRNNAIALSGSHDTFHDLSNTFDISIEAVGSSQSETLNKAIELTKPRGSVFVLGVYPTDFFAHLAARALFFKEVSVQGVNSYGLFHNRLEAAHALRLVTQKPETWSGVVSKVFPLSDFPKALKLFEESRVENNLLKIAFGSFEPELPKEKNIFDHLMSYWPEGDAWQLQDFFKIQDPLNPSKNDH